MHALIAGGSSGIGLALGRRLARRGCALSLVARQRDRLESARRAILDDVPLAEVAIASADIADADACDLAVAECVRQFGPLHWAVNCAGIVSPIPFLAQSVESHHQQMRTNYFGSLNFARSVVPSMIGNGGGKLVLVASAAAICGIYGYSGYAASKFAVRALAECLQVELAGEGISVTLVYPPDTDTPQLAEERKLRSRVTEQVAGNGGVWSADDVARAIERGVDAGKATIVPGLVLKAFYALQGILWAPFRMHQRALVRASKKSGD